MGKFNAEKHLDHAQNLQEELSERNGSPNVRIQPNRVGHGAGSVMVWQYAAVINCSSAAECSPSLLRREFSNRTMVQT